MIAGPATGNTFDRREPIPGYKTTDLLGRGGYGEVWKAIAPGGISKAVKIIYGDSDPTKAEGELRALARIKDVRHPLLLSIERIEMCEGNLVIVTELADGSLKDRFVKLRQEQAVGIPQEELLKYISDAGEALDYLYENFSLQHLDVKPENILLLSGRGKLGDFGLVKNLYERSASMVGGLTPTYAPPELFEGKPNRHSDQYGLAIVYAHMLTGILPFPAGSTAQLAAAHLRGIPDLSALPRSQRPVIARALSKDPAQRFPSCMAFIAAIRECLRADELVAPHAAPLPAWTPTAELPQLRNSVPPNAYVPTVPTQVLPRGQVNSQPQLNALSALVPTAATSSAEMATTRNGDSAGPRSASGVAPIVLIGVGGLGVEVLARLVDRLNDRYGPASQWPPVEMIVLDSHTRSLTSRFREQDLDRVHVVPIPLKAADAYGSQTAELLKWLGRRWFYNIPRDLTTNGYRPLGRLALISNGARVRAALTTVVGKAAKLAAASGRAPRVTLISGVGGGTGSGAVPDLAYAIRSELKRCGLPHECVQGMLLHATPRSHAERDKSRANAYALLRELNHFSAPGSNYPGDSQLGTVPFHGDNAAFGEMLLFQLGEGLGQTDWELAVEQSAEFLFAANFTAAEKQLHPLDRETAVSEEVAPLRAHPTQVIALGAGGSTTIADAVNMASDDIIRFWREGRTPPPAQNTSVNLKTLKIAALRSPGDSDTSAADAAVRQQFQQCQFDVEHLQADATEVIRLESELSIDEFLSNLVGQALDVTKDQLTGSARATVAIAALDRFLQSDFCEELEELGDEQLFLQIVGRLAVRTSGRIKAIFGWVLKMVDTPDQRLDGARRIALAIQRQLQVVQSNALKQAGTKLAAAQEASNTTRSEDFHKVERRGLVAWMRNTSPEQKLHDALVGYARLRLDEFVLRATAKIGRIVDAEVTTLVEQLDRLSRELARLPNTVSGTGGFKNEDDADLTHSSTIVLAYRSMLREQLQIRRYEIARDIDDRSLRELTAQGKELRKYLDPVADLHQSLWQPLVKISRRCVLDCIQDINRQLLAISQPKSENGSMNKVMELLRAKLATTKDQQSQSAIRCLVIPVGTNSGTLGNLSPQTTIIEGPLTDITFCMIERPIPLSEMASELTAGVEMYKDLSSRLLTRLDISWRDLDDTAPTGLAHGADVYNSRKLTLPIS
ncbi:MAG: serine/threonine protein kinase [Planctomycetaceae bacterium]|nr:serine/threonine protein kinase [Planctomycetaceae bacterium]